MIPSLSMPKDGHLARMGPPTLESLLERAGSRHDPALWHREPGAWTPGGESPGPDLRELGAALVHYGVSGKCVLVLGGEGPDTARASLAVLAAGACLVRLDGGTSDALVREALEGSPVALAIVEDDRQLRRVLGLRPDLPHLELVILLAAERSERRSAAILVEAAVEIGAGLLDRDPRLLESARSAAPGDGAPALLVPQGGELRSLSRQAIADAADRLTDEVSIGPGRTVFVSLPTDGLEYLPALLGALARGATVLVAGERDGPGPGLREKPPDSAIVSAAAISRLHAEWVEEQAGAAAWQQRVTRWALAEGADPARHPRRHRLAEFLVLSRIRARWGGRLRGWGVVGGPVDDEISDFFASVGVPIYVMPGVATAAVAR